jgi:phosphatidylglycerol:prolipoprotein diacylglycerol transferase
MIALFPSREVALMIGPLAIHWYGIMYALGFVIGIWLLPRLQKFADLRLTAKQRESLVLYIFLGVLLGGRLGFVLFYGGNYYIENPLKIFAVWEGGMASHGGFIGVILGVFIFCRKNAISILALGDAIVVPVAIGLFLGRLGNLINGELYGTVSTLPWAMSFPGAEGLRHPTQIYAMIKDAIIAFACFSHLKYSWRNDGALGRTSGYFLLTYGCFRFIVEIFREQPYGFTNIAGVLVSRGQLLTVPVIIAGIAILIVRRPVRA